MNQLPVVGSITRASVWLGGQGGSPHEAALLTQVVDFLGSAAFSKAVQAIDLKTGGLVCLKIVKVAICHRFPRFKTPAACAIVTPLQQQLLLQNHDPPLTQT